MTTTGLRLGSGERGDVLQTMLILPSMSTVFTKAYLTQRARLAGTLFSIWKVWYRACICCFSGEMAVERKLYSHRMRETSVCLERWACLPLYVFVSAYERESCISPWEIKPGHSIHRKTLISPFDKKGIESLFRSQPPKEETAGDCYTWVFQHRFRSVSPHTNIPIALISCYLQSNIYCI